MKRNLLIIMFAITLLFGQAFRLTESKYLMGAADDTIELHLITPVIYEV